MLHQCARKGIVYISPTYVIKVTRRHKPNKRNSRTEFVVTCGSPNYEERAFIKMCKKAKEPFPVKKIQLKFYPIKTKGRK